MIRSVRVTLITLTLIFISSLACSQPAKTGASEKNKTSAWPYFADPPPYLAVCGGYEGLKTDNVLIGLAANAFHLNISPSIGGMAGAVLYYKQNLDKARTCSFEADLGIFAGIVFGFNYNYNLTNSGRISGFKPFAGLALYNCQLFYGYCFYDSQADQLHELRHNRITARYILPVARMKKKKTQDQTIR